jgi:hypothetical protein
MLSMVDLPSMDRFDNTIEHEYLAGLGMRALISRSDFFGMGHQATTDLSPVFTGSGNHVAVGHGFPAGHPLATFKHPRSWVNNGWRNPNGCHVPKLSGLV